MAPAAAHPGGTNPVDGLVLVDKPAGLTSHDVVSRLRRLLGTRRVGHAGTLDPMATGLLIVGVNRATRLLGHLALGAKSYAGEIRLGVSTVTDDAEGAVTRTASVTGISEGDVTTAMAALTGSLLQVPCQVSAVKVAGRRAYARVREGEKVALAARPVTVERFALCEWRHDAAQDVLDLTVEVDCSSGTYVRALARDLGAALGAGAHLTRLRRTGVGPFRIEDASTLDDLAEGMRIMSLSQAAAAVFPRWDVDEQGAIRVSHGVPMPATGIGTQPYAVFGPDDDFLALFRDEGAQARPVAVFVA